MTEFAGKIALVTGASRGIGAAIAQTLAAGGARVIGTATSEAGAQAISKQLAAFGGVGMVYRAEEGTAAADALLAEVEKQFGSVSILVNNAGITRDQLLMRMKDADWDDVMQTNLRPVFALAKGVLRGMMKARSGRIINIASVVGVSGNAGQTNYAAAKAAMIGFSKSMAQEVGSRNITVNCVAPGFIATDMTAALPEAQRQALEGQIALGRLGAPEDIAHAVAFLASDKASYITGATLHVNGGMYMV